MNKPVTKIRVALVDDQPLFRAGIRMLIESQADMDLCGEAENGEEAVELAFSRDADVILMDLRMPVLDGVAATRKILGGDNGVSGRTTPKIIALTTFNRDQAVIDAVRAGASGYLLKSAEPEFLIAAIRTVHSGYAVIAPGSVEELFRENSPPTEPDISVLDCLSAREREVFLLAASGAGNSEIGGQLFISEATVKSHLRSLLPKLGLRTRVQLIAFAYEHRLSG
ncbi:response regulator transcription factor [Arthrobacter sp. NQ7]|uniref:response regulator n=1 Tax=Arthrobacter sp. NQ7 TaxID=3032303 RepID=UPI00240FC4E5|nr:response regulator transcription factor [Arthrobacter sp. NQ7]MDJ0459820.1 response regulator transcription factor [Arthrobacter sp. NQ7]